MRVFGVCIVNSVELANNILSTLRQKIGDSDFLAKFYKRKQEYVCSFPRGFGLVIVIVFCCVGCIVWDGMEREKACIQQVCLEMLHVCCI